MEIAKEQPQTHISDTEVSLHEKAFLVHGAQKIPIHAEYASKYSLLFRYKNDRGLTDPTIPVNVVFQDFNDGVELGPCRIISDPNLNGYTGRLVFTENIYDIQSLLLEKKLVDLQSPFKNLAQVLDRKKGIQSAFKNYTADLAFDLSVYKNLFDDLDSQCFGEPEEVKIAAQKAIINSEGQKFMKFFHQTVEDLNTLVAGFDSEEHRRHGFYFRKQLWNFIMCCALMSRTNLKPRGYAGDSMMMKMIYLDNYEGQTTFCKLMQKYTIGVPAAQSVRNRRTLIMGLLDKYRKSNCLAPQDKIRILSVACGPAFEVEDILKSPEDFGRYHFTFLDQDPRALKEAARFISDVEKKYGATADVEFVKMSVRALLGKTPFKKRPRNFHFIYSMGLFDYLSTPVAKAVLNKIKQMLLPGGELVVGNFHVSNPSKNFMEYWGDWHLNHRTEKEFEDLLSDSLTEQVSVIFEDTGSQMFLDLRI